MADGMNQRKVVFLMAVFVHVTDCINPACSNKL